MKYGKRVEGDLRKRVNFTIRESTHEKAQAVASRKGISFSRLVEELIEAALESEPS